MYRTSGFRVKPGMTIKGRLMYTFCIRQMFLVSCILVMSASMLATAADRGDTQKRSITQTDLRRLEGRWLRPDGGYLLELRDAKKDGTLKAAYFNPRPINVLTAKWGRKDGAITVFVELRDVNYPGSTYHLQYDPKSDRLTGTYFQAVEKQTYTIEFVRSQ
jgi:hypothetical protein